MNRRTWLALAGCNWVRGDDYEKSALAGTRPDWEAPLFDLPGRIKAPVVVERIELLRIGKGYYLEAVSKDGVEGIVPVKQVDDYLPMLTRLAMPFFQGKDARRIETLIDEFYIKNYKMAGQALWAPASYVDQALFDLLGKTAGVPVGTLLGGVKRKEIPVYLSGSGRETTAEEEVAVYEQALALSGAKAMKFKIGGRMGRNTDHYPGRTDTMLPLARKKYGESVLIYVDANGGYNAAKAIEVAKMLAELKVGFFEEPCPWEEVSETKRVADAIEMPVAFGECDSSFWKFDHMIRTRALDIVQPDLNYNGGFVRSARVARMAAKAGLPITPHNTQTGAAAASLLHFASAIPNVGPYMEFVFRGKYSDQSYVTSSSDFRIRNGVVKVPEGPGLGVTYDPAYLAKGELVHRVG